MHKVIVKLARLFPLLLATAVAGCGASKSESPPPDPAPAAAAEDPAASPSSTTDNPSAAEPLPVDCKRDDDFGPVLVTPEQFERRAGTYVLKFSDQQSSKERPFEACGLQMSLDLLRTLTCDDGSNPFPNPSSAHASRAGNVGSGGRCGSIVDHYQVPCTEKTYDVYIDFYFCNQADNVF